jgi:mitosis inhibitor protein kinase SWE1
MKVLKSISHPHIVKYIDSFNTGSKFYIIMEYCDKGDLSEYLLRTGTQYDMPEWKVWRLLIQMCLALEQIHANGIIHADLKP